MQISQLFHQNGQLDRPIDKTGHSYSNFPIKNRQHTSKHINKQMMISVKSPLLSPYFLLDKI